MVGVVMLVGFVLLCGEAGDDEKFYVFDERKQDVVSVKAKEDLLYIRGILRKRFDNKINDRVALELLTAAYLRGVKIEDLTGNAKNVASWDEWVKGMVVRHSDDSAFDRTFPGGQIVMANGEMFGDDDDSKLIDDDD